MMAEINEISPKVLINRSKFDDINGFDSRRHLFDFGIDFDLTLNEKKRIPKLKEEFHQNRSGLDIDLNEGMDESIKNNKLIKNYDNKRKLEWTQFLRCLKKNNTIDEEVPTFVTFGSTIANLFTVDKWDSTVFALKYNGVIYLSPDKSLKMDKELVEKEQVVTESYQLSKFQYSVTDKNDSDINDFEMCFTVNRVDFNGNKIIVCNDIDANDRNGSPVYVNCRPIDQGCLDDEHNTFLLIDWVNCKLNGVKTLVLGRMCGSNVKEVVVKDVDSIPDLCRSYWSRSKCEPFWSESKCYSFVDKSLQTIKSCVSSELQLYEFVVNSSDKTLSCFRHENHFLPNFYTI